MKRGIKLLAIILAIIAILSTVGVVLFMNFGKTDDTPRKNIETDSEEHCSITNFKASHFDIYVDTTESVTFTANVDHDADNEAVFLVSENKTIATMNDEGKDGDEHAEDGIFSVAVELYSSEVENIKYYAECENVKSEPFEICYYRDLTEEEIVSFSSLLNEVNELSFEECKRFLQDSDEIESHEINEEEKTVSYKTVYGISGVWQEYEEDTKGNGAFAVDLSMGINYYEAKSILSNAIINTSSLRKRDIAVLRPFRTTEFFYDDFLYAGEFLSEALNSNVDTFDDNDASLEQFKKLDEYGIVLVDSHGGIDGSDPFIVTGEKFDEEAFLFNPIYYVKHISYSADYLSGRIIGVSGNRAGVTSKFFNKYYDDDSLEDSFWFLGCCYSLYNDKIAKSLLNSGANTIFGYTNTVSVSYSNKTLFESVVNSLVLSDTDSVSAVQNATDAYGKNDPRNPKARFELRGDKSFKLIKSIKSKVYIEDIDPSKGLLYELNSDGRSYSVIGLGTCTDTAIVIPSTYEGLPVTSIGEDAFSECGGLTSINIPGSVTSIGDSAFSLCGSLTSINIPDGVTSIGDYAFFFCKSLTSINIPDGVTSIGDSAFSSCERLTSINIPYGVTSIGEGAFSSCKSLTSITIPDSVRSLGNHAFGGCISITSINIPYGVTSIGDYTFSSCENLTSISIPDSVTSIGEEAFSFCESLTSINIPYGVMSIGYGAFCECKKLTSINISKSVKSIDGFAFGCCNSLMSVVIPDSVTSIGEAAFSGCESLTSIVLPNGITSIGADFFAWCSSLTSISIPGSVTSIGKYAFADGKSLKSITFVGTKSEWKAIEKGADWNENVPATVVHCSDGDVAVEG